MSDALELRSVNFSYDGNRPALVDATLVVARGTVCGVLGPNGAGKSTLARLAAGVVHPSAGSVRVAGVDLADISGSRRAAVVRVSFQTPEHELFRRTLGAELDWEASLLGVSAAEMRQRTRESLSACGADVPLDMHPYDLDPWQRKIFACVSALAMPRRLVILDEPTLRLGQFVRSRLGAELRKHAASGGGVVLVTHDHEFAASTCDQIAVVKWGKIDRSGPTATTLEAAAEHAATNIYSFPSFYLDRAVRRRSQLPKESGRELQV